MAKHLLISLLKKLPRFLILRKKTRSMEKSFIPNADPGFDWLFSRSISGLVTTWKANSHMAIRAGGSLPAAMTWEKLPSRTTGAASSPDCKGKRIEVLG